ncbi:hypothetical protein V6N11_011264 [Hibiscus sabdariffa]|uniref:Uncharacterized protein n=1 Tax=Hibiscus sabdariffa TaxID=183260 RepID=A0ABR2S7P4_9ROSI
MYVSRHVVFNEEVFPAAVSSLSSSSPAASSEFQSFPFEHEISLGCPTPVSVEHTDTVASGGSPVSHSSESNETIGVFSEVAPNTEQQTVVATHRGSSSTGLVVDTSTVEAPAARLSATLEQSVENVEEVVFNNRGDVENVSGDIEHHEHGEDQSGYNALVANGTWELVALPDGRRAIGYGKEEWPECAPYAAIHVGAEALSRSN